MLYRIVEKAFSSNMKGFQHVGGVWHPDLEFVRRVAKEMASTSLAHRMFIVRSERAGESSVRIQEEIDLEPLLIRRHRRHVLCLCARDRRTAGLTQPITGELPKAWARRPARPRNEDFISVG
jgi:hypothetical protein